MIVAEGLTRRFVVRDRSRGLAGSLRDLVRRERREATAVDAISFRIRPGEFVGLIGPNGAGKSTTVKLLCGILRPSAGSVRVGGLDPWDDRREHVRRIGVVFGQRTQLWWDLAVIEALDLLAAMYGVPPATARLRIEHFDAVLGIGAYLRTPVRQLSLGERMRCELAAALLHAPPLVILDEPTIGLDVAVKLRLRAFLAGLRDTTLILTTHDLDDVAALCPRVLLLSAGRILHDGPLQALSAGDRRVRVRLRHPVADEALPPGAVRDAEDAFSLAAANDIPAVVRGLLERTDVADLHIEDPPIETLVARYYET